MRITKNIKVDVIRINNIKIINLNIKESVTGVVTVKLCEVIFLLHVPSFNFKIYSMFHHSILKRSEIHNLPKGDKEKIVHFYECNSIRQIDFLFYIYKYYRLLYILKGYI